MCKAVAFMSGGESEVTVGQQHQQSESKARPEVKEHEDKLKPSKTNCIPDQHGSLVECHPAKQKVTGSDSWVRYIPGL